MNEEILSRLERIDHKEYSSGFEFADSSTFDEMARCFEERKILAKEIERLNNILNKLEEYLKGNMNYLTPWEELGVYEEILKKLEELEVNNENN